MLKPLLTTLAIAIAGAANAVAAPSAVMHTAAATPQPARSVVANGKTAEKKARPKASKRPRKASRAETPASGSSAGSK